MQRAMRYELIDGFPWAGRDRFGAFFSRVRCEVFCEAVRARGAKFYGVVIVLAPWYSCDSRDIKEVYYCHFDVQQTSLSEALSYRGQMNLYYLHFLAAREKYIQ